MSDIGSAQPVEGGRPKQLVGEYVGKRSRPEDHAQRTELMQKAFRRMAFLSANLVCGIWLILVVTSAALDETRPEPGTLAVVLLISTPLAYLIPYGLVRALGLLVAAFKTPSP